MASVVRALYLPRGGTAGTGLHCALPRAEEQPGSCDKVLFIFIITFENKEHIAFVNALAFHTNTSQYVNVLASTAHWWWFWVLIVGKSVTIKYWKIRFIVSINKLILTCFISGRVLVTSPIFPFLCVYNTQMMLITLPEFNNIYKR